MNKKRLNDYMKKDNLKVITKERCQMKMDEEIDVKEAINNTKEVYMKIVQDGKNYWMNEIKKMNKVRRKRQENESLKGE